MVVAKKHHELYEELGSIVGAEYVSDDRAVLLSYTRGMCGFPPGKPQGVAVLPGSVEEVVELVRLANQTRTPLIPMGGKITLAGVPSGQPGRGIIVDMRRMDKVIEIDEENMTVTAQCGITLGELAAKVNERGWDIPSAEVPLTATVGGQLSGFTGAGFGGYTFSVGFNWHYLLGIKVVLPDASVLDTGTGEGSVNTYWGQTWSRGMHGPDYTGMFIGDGGTFGIKVEATYRMFRLPKFHKGGVRCWDNLEEAYQALCDLWEIDPFLYIQPYAKAVLLAPEFAAMVTPKAEPTWVLFWYCIGNSEEEIELKAKITEAILDKHRGSAAHPAVAAAGQGMMGGMREMSKAATRGRHNAYELIVSRRDLLEAFKWARGFVFNALGEWDVDRTKLTLVGCLYPAGTGYGMTTHGTWSDQNDLGLQRAIHESFVEFMEQAKRRGYVIEASQSYEAKLRAKQWTPEFHNYVLTQKKTLDPNNIMNPGMFFL